MKRVNLRTGLKQRINEILGTDSGTEGDVPGLTPWSIQAAMIDNLRRINAALVGDAQGRPMRGLWLTKSSALSVAISAGYGLTPAGDMVKTATSITSNVDSADGTEYVYLRHKMATIDGDTYNDGKKTGFIGKAGTQDIVYDDFAASKKDTIQSFVGEILVISSTPRPPDPDLIYIGSAEVLSNDITVITNSTSRGLSPNTPSGVCRVAGLDVNGNSTFIGTVDINGDVEISAGKDLTLNGDLIISATSDVKTPGGDGVTDTSLEVGDGSGGSKLIKFRNGIYVGPV